MKSELNHQCIEIEELLNIVKDPLLSEFKNAILGAKI
jgi:hypothetical protein